VFPTPHPADSPVVRHGVRMLAAGLCLAAGAAIWALIVGRFDDLSVRVVLTGLTAWLCTLAGLAGASARRLERPKRSVGEVTIALSELTLVLSVALIWIPDAARGDVFLRTFGVTSALLLAAAHASLLLSRLNAFDARPVHRLCHAAIACASAAALLLSGVFALAEGPVASGIWRLLGVLVVLALLNTILVSLARKITRDTRRRTGERPGPSARPCV
jgi:hypothetical protein